jgi:hypothetical protein
MNESLTPEEARAKIIAELMARPGPKPLKPIPPEIMAELLADQIPAEQAEQEYRELMEKGGVSMSAYVEELKRKYPNAHE